MITVISDCSTSVCMSILKENKRQQNQATYYSISLSFFEVSVGGELQRGKTIKNKQSSLYEFRKSGTRPGGNDIRREYNIG